MKKFYLFFYPLVCLILHSCEGLLSSSGHSPLIKEQVSAEIEEIQFSLRNHSTQLQIFSERLDQLEESPKKSEKEPSSLLNQKITSLEKKNEELRLEVNRLTEYIVNMGNSLKGYQDCLQALDKKVQDVGKLRQLLQQASKNITDPQASQNYIVKPGDSLQKIAHQFHTSVEEIQKQNHLKNDKILIGQELIIHSSK